MDVLTDALAAMRTGPTRSARTDVRAPWGLRFPAVTGTIFHVVLQGTCWLLRDHAAPLALGPGDVIFLREGSAHSLADDPNTPRIEFIPKRTDPSAAVGHVHIPGDGAHAILLCGTYQLDRVRPHPMMGELPELLHLPARPGRRAELARLVELLATEFDEDRAGRDGIVPALVDAMLLYILRAWADDCADTDDPKSSGWARALGDPAISRALREIHAQPAHAWTVADLAVRTGMSRSAFSDRFTALVGEPPVTYLTWWRMTTAGRLLRESDAPLSAVAQRVGYTSEFAFAKAFKREFGLPPGRYRHP